MKKLIFDLRNNSGGYLDQAVAIADFFLPGGRTIVYTEGRIPSANEKYYSTSVLPVKQYPLVILINRGTASSAEIFTASLQDWDRAVIVGESSFGKGLVQNQVSLNDGSAVRISVAQYFSPFGRPIQRTKYEMNLASKHKPDDVDKRIYSTYSGRKVYGGCGIQPDVEEKLSPISSTTMRLEAKMLFFEFASQLAPNIKKVYKITRDNGVKRRDVFSRKRKI